MDVLQMEEKRHPLPPTLCCYEIPLTTRKTEECCRTRPYTHLDHAENLSNGTMPKTSLFFLEYMDILQKEQEHHQLSRNLSTIKTHQDSRIGPYAHPGHAASLSIIFPQMKQNQHRLSPTKNLVLCTVKNILEKFLAWFG